MVAAAERRRGSSRRRASEAIDDARGARALARTGADPIAHTGFLSRIATRCRKRPVRGRPEVHRGAGHPLAEGSAIEFADPVRADAPRESADRTPEVRTGRANALDASSVKLTMSQAATSAAIFRFSVLVSMRVSATSAGLWMSSRSGLMNCLQGQAVASSSAGKPYSPLSSAIKSSAALAVEARTEGRGLEAQALAAPC